MLHKEPMNGWQNGKTDIVDKSDKQQQVENVRFINALLFEAF